MDISNNNSIIIENKEESNKEESNKEESNIERPPIELPSIEESIKDSKKNGCQELRNLEYKNVLMCGNNLKPNTKNEVDVTHIENILSKETELNKLDLWTKLDKTDKITKLNTYGKKLCELHKLSEEEVNKLNIYFIYCLDRKHISKIKDVDYNRESGIINNIPNLVFNEDSRIFCIKKNDKHVSTLKSLAPKKNRTAKQ